MTRLGILLVCLLYAVEGYTYNYDAIRGEYHSTEGSVYDRSGRILYVSRIDLKHRKLDWTRSSDISEQLKQYVVRIEDQRFYKHHGFDIKAMFRSLFHLFTGRKEGFSTISMQVVTLLDPSLKPHGVSFKSFYKKIRQIILARRLERSLTKDQILDVYLNMVSFKGELEGVSAASEGLFNKHPSGLDKTESLILASLVKNPNFGKDALVARVCYFSKELGLDCNTASSMINTIYDHPHPIRSIQLLNPALAKKLLDGKNSVESTIDADLQMVAQNSLDEQISSLRLQNVKQGAVLVVENRTGNILAYVSGSDSAEQSFVDGVKAKRQVGSSIKPFLYALALEEKYMTAASLIDDYPINIPLAYRGIYRPNNFDNTFHGLVTLRQALASSINIPAVKVLDIVSVDSLLGFMKSLKIETPQDPDFYGLSLALGSIDLNLFEMTRAYGAFANKGMLHDISFFKNDKNMDERVISEETALIISDIMSDKNARSLTFGMESSLNTNFWSAVKTGTSKDMRDNWCIGFTDTYTVGVWVGNFSGESMWNVSGVSGAAPVWAKVMNYLNRGDVSQKPKQPATVVAREVVNLAQGRQRYNEYFIKGTEQTVFEGAVKGQNPKIIYPPADTIFAMDPDIPKKNQRIIFEASVNNPIYRLNGLIKKDPSWDPKRGKYTLNLLDNKNKVLDSVSFYVK